MANDEEEEIEELRPEDLRRMDFIQETDYVEKSDGYWKFEAVLRPNPERYDHIDEDGKKGWLDTLDNVFIPEDVLAEASEQLDGTPIYYSPPDVDNIDKYVEERTAIMESFLSDQNSGYQFINERNEVLEYISGKDQPGFVILCIDLVGSTSLSLRMESIRYRNMVQLYISECKSLIKGFGGYILKISGDGIVAFFPEPNLVGMHDNAIDCAICLRILMEKGVNPVLEEYRYPKLQYRIGLDSGSAVVTGFEDGFDLIGVTVNLASKIQSAASPGEILMGEITERNLHTKWRRHTIEVTDEKNWEYERDGEPYALHSYCP